MSKLYGVPDGLLIGQQSRVDEINERIGSRQFSDQPLAPNFDPRPVMTKYMKFPALDRIAPASEIIQPSVEHNVHSNFSPATQNGPPNTYFRNIDVETTLRNQTVSLQRGATQGVYVPSSNSDLYRVYVPSTPGPQPHKGLFQQSSFTTNPRSHNIKKQDIGKDAFNNHTRTQLRAL